MQKQNFCFFFFLSIYIYDHKFKTLSGSHTLFSNLKSGIRVFLLSGRNYWNFCQCSEFRTAELLKEWWKKYKIYFIVIVFQKTNIFFLHLLFFIIFLNKISSILSTIFLSSNFVFIHLFCYLIFIGLFPV